MGGAITIVLVPGVWMLRRGASLGWASLVGHSQVMTSSSATSCLAGTEQGPGQLFT